MGLVCRPPCIYSSGLSWTSHHRASIRLVCHELHIVMNFTSIHLVCHELHIYSPGLSSAMHLFTWFVMNFTSSWTSHRHELRIRSSAVTFASLCFRCVVVHGLHIYSPSLSWTSHLFVANFTSVRHGLRIRLLWTLHPFVTNFTSVRHELHIVMYPLCCCSWFSHLSIHLFCHELRIRLSWTSHRRVSIHLVCHELRIRSSATHPFVWFAMNFASLCCCSWFSHPFASSRIDSSGLSWFSHLLCIYSSVHGCCQVTRWFVMGWFSFVTWLLFVSRVGCVGSHFVCGFRVCPVCW